MTVRAFLPYADRRLHIPADPVGAVTETVRMIWDDMVDTMEAMPGVGLAAPQIGIMLRLAVVDAGTQVVLQTNFGPRAVTVRFVNEAGEVEDRDFVGLWATSVQHQIDHLDGRMYVDHLSPLRRKMLVAKSAKLARR